MAVCKAAALPLPMPLMPPPLVIISEPAEAALLARRSCDDDMGIMPAPALMPLLLPPEEWVLLTDSGRGNGMAAAELTDEEPRLERVMAESGPAAVAPAGPNGGRAGEPVLLIMIQFAGSARRTAEAQCKQGRTKESRLCASLQSA